MTAGSSARPSAFATMTLVSALVLAGWLLSFWVRSVSPVGDSRADPAVIATLLADGPPTEGADDADLTLIVFTDYRCPACRAAAAPLAAALARDGRVRVVYRDWPIFGEPSTHAARVAIAAAAQGIYPALHRRLMTERRPLDDAVLAEHVRAAGGDWSRVQAALADEGAAIDGRLAATSRAAHALGLAGTPAWVAGNVVAVGALDERGFAKLFAEGRGG